MHFVILSTSVRIGRNSHSVGLYFKNYIEYHGLSSCDLIDLNEYRFPIFTERLRFMKQPSEEIMLFAERMQKADGVIVITPEYNGSYPASLKNIIDLLSDEWKGKPTGIVTVSTGAYGGVLVYPSLVFSLWKKGVWVVPARYSVSKVQNAFDRDGTPAEKEKTDGRTKDFLNALLWSMEARRRMM